MILSDLELERKKKAEYMKAWNLANPDKAKEIKRKTYEKNKEKILAKNKEYRINNPISKEYMHNYYLNNIDKIKKRAKDYVVNNRENVSEKRRIYRINNSEDIKNKLKAHYLKNKESYNEKSYLYLQENRNKIYERLKEYYKCNPEKTKLWRFNSKSKRRMRINNTIIPFNAEQLSLRLSMYGNRCWICGKHGNEIDHVIPLAKGGIHTLSNFRPACSICNRKKGTKSYKFIKAYKIA